MRETAEHIGRFEETRRQSSSRRRWRRRCRCAVNRQFTNGLTLTPADGTLWLAATMSNTHNPDTPGARGIS